MDLQAVARFTHEHSVIYRSGECFMAWLQRLFNQEKPQNPQQAIQGNAKPTANIAAQPQAQTVPPERRGLNGEYDQSGLAKRVALAFDQDEQLDDIETLFVAQTDSTVVLKGKVPNQQLLSRMVQVAKGVPGATAVETDQVKVG